MRIVLVPQGTHGDIRPLVALGQALQRAGHAVVFGASPNSGPWFEQLGIELTPVGLDLEAPSGEAERSVGNPLRSAIMGLRLIDALVSEQFAAVQELAAGADLIISSGLEFAGRSIAERLSIPYRFVCHVPTALRSRFHPPAAIPYRPLPPWLNRALWAANTLGARVTFGRRLQQGRRQLGLPPIQDLAAFFTRDVVLSADEALAPLPPDCAVAFRSPYYALEEDRPLDSALEEFLASGPAPVYLGFGSMVDPDPDRTLDLLRSLAREHRLVVSSARAEQRCPAPHPDLHWVRAVPHHALFRRVAAVVHHGGAGTTHTAARAGVPQVIVPHLVDQYYWADRVHRLGLGPPPLRRNDLSARTLGAALRTATQAQALRRTAAELGQRLADAAARSLEEAAAYFASLR